MSPTSSTKESSPSTPKLFAQLSERQKRRRTEALRQSSSPEEINYVASKNFKDADAKYVFNYLIDHPEHAKKVRQFCEDLLIDKDKSLTDSDSLSMYVNADLTKRQYLLIRSMINKISPKLMPGYTKIQHEKEKCYPQTDMISVTEGFVKVNLQSLLDTTMYRLFNLITFNHDEIQEWVMFLKWGCDGASGQSMYKQTFSDDNINDSSIFMCSMVPLKLYISNSTDIVWQNPTPSSSRYCRPIYFKYEKENKELTKRIIDEIEEEIKHLRPFVYGNVIVNYNLVLTMVDTKICNDLTGTDSAMKCFICGATPRNMNKLDQIFDKTPNSDNYRFGISSLHAWIRTFECLLHIAYNLPFKSWSARGENKKIKEDSQICREMLKIQEEFRSKTGLLVDIVKQGAGKTNDGNTARRFFSEYKTSAQITGLNEDLIKRLFVILQVIASGLHINVPRRFQTVHTGNS
ncbi:hypothetical protein ABMA27_006487 [Loxostege sticticalis]|uniref:V(D)J recombination-activating protein 1 RNase H domain-containing protein n=1 Tax=Loxostege sticticalis TaxID=481309 RepID=A0ABR3IJG3_LOXSC